MSDVNGEPPNQPSATTPGVWPSSIADGRTAAFDQAARAGSAMLAVLDRALPVLRRVAGGVRFVAWSGIAAAAMIVLSVLLVTGVPSAGGAIAVAVFGLVLAVPGGLLLLFHGAIVEALALPDWLRSSPDLARTHATELARLARVSAGDGAPTTRRGFVSNFFKAGKLLLEAHGDFPEYGKTLRLISVPFLFAVGVSFIAVIVEWIVALTTFVVALLIVLVT